jgi:hypothetical protein
MVFNVPLGAKFDEGILALHDGVNLRPQPPGRTPNPATVARENTDFTFVKWNEVARIHDLDVGIDGSNSRSSRAPAPGLSLTEPRHPAILPSASPCLRPKRGYIYHNISRD